MEITKEKLFEIYDAWVNDVDLSIPLTDYTVQGSTLAEDLTETFAYFAKTVLGEEIE